MTGGIPFVKMVAAGNDFVLVDTVHRPLRAAARRWPAVARVLCDRRNGVGADGLLVLGPSRIARVAMRVFNPDGSEAEMCGNGARCAAALVHGWSDGAEGRGGVMAIETAAGLVHATVAGGRVRLRMPDPTGLRLGLRLPVLGRTVRAGFVNTGVPHLVVPVPDVETVEVARLGRALRGHRRFRPRGTNVDFVEARGERIHIRTYERGVEAETLACGTGVTAAGVMQAVTGDGPRGGVRRILVRTRSGDDLSVTLRLEGHGASARAREVVLEGPVRRVCEGVAVWPRGGRG